MPTLAKCARDRRGAALTEFALVAPVFLALTMGLIGYGGYFWRAHLIQQIANDGARASLPGLTSGERQALAVVAVNQELTALAGIDVRRTATTVSEANGAVLVAVQYDGSQDALLNVSMVPLPSKTIKRVAAVRIGGL